MKKNFLLILFIIFCFSAFSQNNTMKWIKVEGNKFTNETGQTIVFRGFNIADPADLKKKDKWDKKLFEQVKAWGANIVRIPVHPKTWNELGTKNYLKLLDEAIEWCHEKELYIIIDWHSIGNLRTELFFLPSYNTTIKETFEFWRIVADKYKNEPVVAFYEIYNEPTTMNNQLGSCTWQQWKDLASDIITIILANNPKAIPLVAGFNWAYDLSPVKNEPLNIPGIAYVSHPYPEKCSQPWEPKWEEDWGFVADKYPVILTEIGFALPTEKGVHVPVHGDETYGNAIVNYSKSKGISWVVWVFDAEWAPMMIKDWDYTPTAQGAFFKKVLLEKK